MRILIILAFLFPSVVLFGHSPNEVTYIIQPEESGWSLTVHLTPTAAIKVLRQEVPALRDQPVIPLNDYHRELTTYFERTLDISFDGRPAKLRLVKADLDAHDSWLRFQLKETPDAFAAFSITVNSFTELFYHPVNVVKLALPGESQTCFLDDQNRSYLYPQSDSSLQVGSAGGVPYYWVLAILGIGAAMMGKLVVRAFG